MEPEATEDDHVVPMRAALPPVPTWWAGAANHGLLIGHQ
jgi:hypothetical protein